MTLADFIETQLLALLADWAQQARRLGVGEPRPLDSELEDSARRLVEQIISDMRQPQTDAQRDAKSMGGRPGNAPGITDAARAHAEQRLALGCSLNDMVAEYRALRASVVRHWLDASRDQPQVDLRELVRFDESVDQALTESIACYTAALDRIRDLFVGILAHDLRTPLGAISACAQYLLRLDDLSERHLAVAGNIHRSSKRAEIIIGDLVNFTRARLGGTLPINVAQARLDRICEHALSEVGSLHPDEKVYWNAAGDLSGTWDAARIEEMLINLLENAIDHGRHGGDIHVEARDNGGTVSVSVSNEGTPISPDDLRTLFDPLKRPSQPARARRAGVGLGLGLFIAREIVVAHGGSIVVTSAHRTSFTVTLPRESVPVSGKR